MNNRIKDLRENAHMRQADLAEAVGIDQRTISNYETGKTYPDSYALIKLADFFNVSIDYLVCRTDYNLFAENSTKEEMIKKIIQNTNELHKSIHSFLDDIKK